MKLFKRLKLEKTGRRRLYLASLIAFSTLNVIAFAGAYISTHFVEPGQLGIGVPRPNSSKRPSDFGLKYSTHRINISQNEWLEAWLIPSKMAASKGTIILFPGSGSSKARQLLMQAQVFNSLGYDTLLVDFRGVGGSSGNTNTIGIREAQDVVSSLNYARTLNSRRPIVLYGISMGSAAILKAIAQENIQPDAIIIEEPFARLVNAIGSRVQANYSIPAFPLTELIIFWGGIQHGFNGFTHNPVDYATQVKCPTLVLQGKLDEWTTEAEIEQIFANLQGVKKLSIYPNAGHDLLVSNDPERWQQDIKSFLAEINKN